MKKVLTVCWVLFLLSCNEQDQPTIYQPGPDYFPLASGRYFIYDVDSTAILFSVETKKTYQVRHLVADSFRNEEGGYTYVILRSQRASQNASWRAMPTWQARLSSREVVVQEQNVPYVKLSFPLSNGLVWNGNALNTLEGPDRCESETARKCDKFTVSEFQSPFTAAGLSFEQTVLVEENNDPDLISIHDVRIARYAKDVGLVYVEKTVLKYCSNTPACLGAQIVDQGLRYKMTLREYGKM